MSYDQPIKPDKGLYQGSCNRRACQRSGATFYNKPRGWSDPLHAYYCEDCALEINRYALLDGSEAFCIPVEDPEHPHYKLGPPEKIEDFLSVYSTVHDEVIVTVPVAARDRYTEFLQRRMQQMGEIPFTAICPPLKTETGRMSWSRPEVQRDPTDSRGS